jgi:hypothetical protein
VVVQYFSTPAHDRSRHITAIAGGLKALQRPSSEVELVVMDDSASEHREWVEALAGVRGAFIIHAPNLHEVRSYNRGALFSNAEYVAFMHDDSDARDSHWLVRAVALFKRHPSLGLLGGGSGKMDDGDKMEVRQVKNVPGYTTGPMWMNLSPKYGMHFADLDFVEDKTGIPFQFMYKVQGPPLIVKRKTFLKLGMFHTGLSCPGNPGLTFEAEYSVRTWKHDYKVGLYYSYVFEFDGAANPELALTNVNATIAQLSAWRRNNLMLYYMYPDFHHAQGSKKARQAEEKHGKEPLTCEKINEQERPFVNQLQIKGCASGFADKVQQLWRPMPKPKGLLLWE